MSDPFTRMMITSATCRWQAKQLCKFFQGNPSLFPQELILPEDKTIENWCFACELNDPVNIDDCEIIGLLISYPPDLGGNEIETALLGPDGFVHPSELGYDDVCRHYLVEDLVGHLRDLIQKLYASG